MGSVDEQTAAAQRQQKLLSETWGKKYYEIHKDMERLGFKSEKEYNQYIQDNIFEKLFGPGWRRPGNEKGATVGGAGETPQKISADTALVVSGFLTLSRDDQLQAMALIQRCITGDSDRVRDEVRRLLLQGTP